ncbi:MAG: L-threonylcarbamoyladenylate synthase [Bacteroidetes bacterium]|nr:L-threonylcarbamoyladenylate synthase [Bacteroidota bacterium]
MEQIELAVQHLVSGNTILYPTDTIWGLGCDATNEDAVDNISRIKHREHDGYIVLVSDMVMLKNIVTEISPAIEELAQSNERPTTIIYPSFINLAQNISRKEGSIAIRLVRDGYCHQLIKQFKYPIVSTSANISGNKAPLSFAEIDEYILSAVDHVVNLPNEKIGTEPSRIIKVGKGDKITTIRS